MRRGFESFPRITMASGRLGDDGGLLTHDEQGSNPWVPASTGCSAAWSARSHRTREAAGSNPAIPTDQREGSTVSFRPWMPAVWVRLPLR